jgi:hypothetical protein
MDATREHALNREDCSPTVGGTLFSPTYRPPNHFQCLAVDDSAAFAAHVETIPTGNRFNLFAPLIAWIETVAGGDVLAKTSPRIGISRLVCNVFFRIHVRCVLTCNIDLATTSCCRLSGARSGGCRGGQRPEQSEAALRLRLSRIIQTSVCTRNSFGDGAGETEIISRLEGIAGVDGTWRLALQCLERQHGQKVRVTLGSSK